MKDGFHHIVHTVGAVGPANQRGTALIEFAIVLPFLLVLTFMVIGAVLFSVVAIGEGAGISTSIFDGVNYSMAAFSTGSCPSR